MVRTFIIVAAALGGLFLLAKRRTDKRQPLPQPPLMTRQYHDRLANHLEAALSHGNRPMWDEVSAEWHREGRGDLPESKREEWPEWAEQTKSHRILRGGRVGAGWRRSPHPAPEVLKRPHGAARSGVGLSAADHEGG